MKKTGCACDAVVELTAQYELHNLQQTLNSATKQLLDIASLEWNFSPSQMDDALYHSKVEVSCFDGSTSVHLFSEDVAVASLNIPIEISEQAVTDLKTLGQVYINQLRHITLCNFDQLTGVFNRQAFNEKIGQICSKPNSDNRRRKQSPKTLALIDIDFFKNINDKFGHVLGDEVLVIMGQKFINMFREDDLCFRYGGEEFAVILSGVDEQQAFTIVSRFRKSIESHNFPQIGKVTISAGLAQYHNFMQPSELIEKADRALYYSKDNGRNAVHCYQHLIDSGKIIDKFGGSELELL